jgi:hypothetical protein
MNTKKALIRGLITSAGHISLLMTLFALSLIIYFNHRFFTALIASIAFVILTAIHIPFTMYRERIKHFNNSNVDRELAIIHQKLDQIIEMYDRDDK